ncbi:acyltransferase [Rhizobium sp. SG570]|uniref:acyltransferase family protein n=1 Tax=Rhizobium sp. SG570 TaxID=2587113 RepID=UPI0014479E8E|nr:acyltransferase [Rhizobium sp. SG570]NKJ35268.1 peptidoglycan/LPS O-acetylase OafA/YrhL [Rhizobium sp. SG570]
MQNEKPRLLPLDFVRIFAAYWVLFHHWSSTGGFLKHMKLGYEVPQLPGIIHAFLLPGYLGVDIFFILSGVVIGRSAVDRSWKQFAKARFVRLFPAYFMATLIAILLAPLTVSDHPPLSQLWLSLSGLQWFFGYPTIVGPAWTLFIEIRFYILIAVVIAVAGRCSAARLMAFAQIWLLILLFAPSLNIDWLNFLFLAEYGCYFALGMVVGLCRSRQDIAKNIPVIVLGMIVSWVRMQARSSQAMPDPAIAQLVSAAIISAVMAMAYFAVESKPATAGRMDKIVVTLALATYPIYLLHEPIGMPLIAWLRWQGVGFTTSLLIAVVMLTALSVIFAKALEPFVGRKVRDALDLGGGVAASSSRL